MSELYVPVLGGRLFVVDEGSTALPPILLLHAGIANLRSWDALVPALLAAGYRVVRYDSRGYGRTETDDVEFSERADTLAVMDALGIGRAALVGNSRGGANAFDVAIESPDRVAAVVGVGAGLRGLETDVTDAELAAAEAMEAVELALESAVGDDRAPIAEELIALETAFWMDGPGQPPDRVPVDLRDALMAMDRDHLTPGRAEGRPIRMTPVANDRIADLRCPVLAVAGELDVTEVAQTARYLEANAPDARAVILPGVAHMIGMEVPEELADLIIDFLAPLPRWA